MKSKKLISVMIALCMLLSLGITGITATAFAADDPIVIGVISPNTGTLAAYGTGIVTGVQLAAEEINAAGGILGRQVELVITDDQGDPTECLNAFNSLVAKGVTLIIGSATSGCTSAITDAANEEEVCILCPTGTADSLTTEDDYIFRACYADSFQGAIAAAYAKQAGFEKVGVVYCAADVYSKGLFDSFSKACGEYGIEVAASQSTASLDVQDYTNQFAAMVTAGVDFVYAPYYYDVIGPYVVPQARAAGYTGIIMGADSEIVRSFVAAYEAAYGSIPSAFGATGYDCLYIYKAAMEAAGSAEADAVRDALADTSTVYECVTGTFSLDESGTPVKGAAIISFQSEGDAVTSTLVDVVTQLP